MVVFLWNSLEKQQRRRQEEATREAEKQWQQKQEEVEGEDEREHWEKDEVKAQEARKQKEEEGKEKRLRKEREEEKKTWRESEEEKERKELEEKEKKLEEDREEAESWMEEIRRQLQETMDSLKEKGMGFEPKEADTMAAARSDDEEAAITTNDAAAVGSAIATEATCEQRGVMEGGGSKAEKDEASKCKVCQKTTRESWSRCRAREGNKQKKEDRMGWYSVSASEEEDGGREASVEVPPGIMVEREYEEKEDRRRTDNLAARVQKLEEQVRGMHQKMWEAMSFTGAVTEKRVRVGGVTAQVGNGKDGMVLGGSRWRSRT